MKKHLIFLCALTAVAIACNVEESELNSDLRIVTVTATYESFPDSKSYYDDEGYFSWAADDEITVRTTNNSFGRLAIDEGVGESRATFSGYIVGQLTGLAVYPFLGIDTTPEYEDGVLKVCLPESYNWVEGVAYNPMVSLSSEDEASSLNFKNLGALFKVTLNNIPATATEVVFTTGKRISGWFTVNSLTNTVSNEWSAENAAYIETDDSDEGVTFTFTGLQEPTDMVFYVPVPTGTYPYIAFDVKNEDGGILWGFKGQRNQEMPRNTLMIMQPLTYPEGDAERDTLPKDPDDVEVDSGDSGDGSGDGNNSSETD